MRMRTLVNRYCGEPDLSFQLGGLDWSSSGADGLLPYWGNDIGHRKKNSRQLGKPWTHCGRGTTVQSCCESMEIGEVPPELALEAPTFFCDRAWRSKMSHVPGMGQGEPIIESYEAMWLWSFIPDSVSTVTCKCKVT